MRSRSRGRLLTAIVLIGTGVMVPTPTSAGEGDASGLTASSLAVESRFTSAKSTTAKRAQTDPSLLGRTDDTPVDVVVKLDYDATAAYMGDIEGLPATSPSVTGVELTGSSAAEQQYETYTDGIDQTFRSQVASAVPGAELRQSLTRVYGGVAMRVPANQVSTVLSLPNVAAVQVDSLSKPQTDSSTEFIGAPTIWAQEGGQALAGAGVIFGDLDTGIWPEHPSFADNADLAAPPPKADGTPRTCDYGDNPLTVEVVDVFVCNNKLIGGQPFLDTYLQVASVPEPYPDSARDSNGHGTHTSSTAAGSIVESAEIFGVDRGRISGVAPGAWVIEYKVCGIQGCISSDSVAAVEQAILDGVDVINFSISGGANPYTDPVELAFLDAYEAGITVATSAGNSGPGADTTDHRSPWVITVAASSQTRAFESTLTLTGASGTTQLTGASITAGVEAPTRVVLAQDIVLDAADPPKRYDSLCSTPLPPGAAAGVIVACARGVVGRAEKGFNVRQGGAVGMILYNPTLQDVETDNHWLPTIHLPQSNEFLAFMAANPEGVQGTFTPGVEVEGQGDVMAGFSSRGPGGSFLKPDITAPGVQVLAGHSPTPDDVAGGPAGEYFQAIAGTSMSSPHIAGSAILLQALHPEWGPGAIKSAMMTTATTDVVKEDEVTPADPFDTGAGRVDLTQAGDVQVVFQDTARRMLRLGADPMTAAQVNLPSINVPTMPGVVRIIRTAKNLSDRPWQFEASSTVPDGSRIRVTPASGVIQPGQSQRFEIVISSSAPEGQYFGQVRFTSSSSPALHLPVAFFNQQGDVSLAQACAADQVQVTTSTTCTVTAQNNSFGPAEVSAFTGVTDGMRITRATGARVQANGKVATARPVMLAGKTDADPAIAPSTDTFGYVPLASLDVEPIPVGDEEIINFSLTADPGEPTPSFQYGGQSYTRFGVTSNGYLVVGGGGAEAIDFVPQDLPDEAAPNGVLAPYWTDLDGAAAPGVYVSTIESETGPEMWLVVEWQEHLWGSTKPDDLRTMQVWIGLNGAEDITYKYAENTLGKGTPAGYGLTIGAENVTGTAGAMIGGVPTGNYEVTTSGFVPGGALQYSLTLRGTARGYTTVTSAMRADTVFGYTVVSNRIHVIRRF